MAHSRSKSKGRSDNKGFVKLYHDILRSDEWCALSPYSTKLFIDLLNQFNGRNNGDLTTAWKIMLERNWKSKDTLFKSIHELEDGGWILRTRQGGLHKCNLFAVTCFPIDECKGKHDISPTNVAPNTWKKTSSPVRQPDLPSTPTVLKSINHES